MSGREIQVVITMNPVGGVTVTLNPATPASPLEVLGLLDVGRATVLGGMKGEKPSPDPPGIVVVGGAEAAAIARDAREIKRP